MRELLFFSRLAFLVSIFVLPVYSQNPEFFPVDDLREGMKGVGLTVFHGTTIEEFDVEILGVLKNSSPKQDMVLARISGGPLEHTGVIQGMSGSPVYIEGKLVGAVAFAFPFSKDPIAGIQPINQMVRILDEIRQDEIAQVSFPIEGPTAYINRFMVDSFSDNATAGSFYPTSWMSSLTTPEPSVSSGLTQIRTPLFISGVSPVAVRQFSALFEGFGFTPVQGGGSASARHLEADDHTIEPGASINAELVRGDINVSANGTVTHVDGEKVFAFGHPFMSTGPTDVPMSKAYVISHIPSVSASFKIAVPLDVVGVFMEDRATGILGLLGESSQMIPVRLDLQTSRGNTEHYEFEVVHDKFLTPFMMNFSVFSAIQASERSLGESTLKIAGVINLADGERVEIENAFTGDMNGPVQATLATVAPISYILSSGFEGLLIDSVELKVVSSDQKFSAELEALRVDQTEVRGGDTVTLSATLRGGDGVEFVEEYSLRIPVGLVPGQIQLVVGDGISMTSADLNRVPQRVPRDIQQMLKELSKLRKTDRLYVQVMSPAPGVAIAGEELPSLPPSMLAMIQSGRSSDLNTFGIRNSMVDEFELPPSDYIIQGKRSLDLTIIR